MTCMQHLIEPWELFFIIKLGNLFRTWMDIVLLFNIRRVYRKPSLGGSISRTVR